jgi:hypothetical protein
MKRSGKMGALDPREREHDNEIDVRNINLTLNNPTMGAPVSTLKELLEVLVEEALKMLRQCTGSPKNLRDLIKRFEHRCTALWWSVPARVKTALRSMTAWKYDGRGGYSETPFSFIYCTTNFKNFCMELTGKITYRLTCDDVGAALSVIIATATRELELGN